MRTDEHCKIRLPSEPQGKADDERIVAEIRAITDDFEGYGYRRVDAELCHRGFIVNAKKVRRLMREHDLNARRRRRCRRPKSGPGVQRPDGSGWPADSTPWAPSSVPIPIGSVRVCPRRQKPCAARSSRRSRLQRRTRDANGLGPRSAPQAHFAGFRHCASMSGAAMARASAAALPFRSSMAVTMAPSIRMLSPRTRTSGR